jgi:hypothetical protein
VDVFRVGGEVPGRAEEVDATCRRDGEVVCQGLEGVRAAEDGVAVVEEVESEGVLVGNVGVNGETGVVGGESGLELVGGRKSCQSGRLELMGMWMLGVTYLLGAATSKVEVGAQGDDNGCFERVHEVQRGGHCATSGMTRQWSTAWGIPAIYISRATNAQTRHIHSNVFVPNLPCLHQIAVGASSTVRCGMCSLR